MQMRNLFFLSFIVTMGAACPDADLPEPDKQVTRIKHAKALGEAAKAERRAMVGQHLVKPSERFSISSATDMANALDIPEGLVTSAELAGPAEAAQVFPSFGVIGPRQGNSLVVLSTGQIDASSLPEPGSDFSPAGTDGDAATFRVTVNVPRGVNRMSFDFNFLSAESPDFINSEFNDMFTVKVTDARGTRVAATASVNSSFFFDASQTRAGGTGFDLLLSSDPSGVDTFPSDAPLHIPLFPDAGITGFKTVNVEVAGGGLVTVEFDIRDLGDGFLDSTVVIDNMNFSAIEVIDPNPSLIHGFLGTVVIDPVQLATGGSHVQGVAADGVTQLLLRIKVPGPGQMKFSLIDAASPADGGIGAVGSASRSNSVTVAVQQVTSGNYYAFALYTSPEDFNTGSYAQQKSRSVKFAAQYLPTSGSGFQSENVINIVRPPVVVLHDFWSNCQQWTSGLTGIYVDPLFDVTCLDYSSSGSLEQNVLAVPDSLFKALSKLRDNEIAVTQADVIAHGMGGLLARKYVDWSGYHRSINFNKGDFNRLITMNTPHLGTRLADETVVMREHLRTNNPAAFEVLKKSLSDSGAGIGINVLIDGPEAVAIDDLQTGSDAINSIGETRVPSHVFVSKGGRAITYQAARPMLYPVTKALYAQMESLHPDTQNLPQAEKRTFILGSTSKLFCTERDEHDLFVAVAEQRGGVGGAAVSEFVVSSALNEHFKAQNSSEFHDKLVTLLNSPVNSESFAPSIPSPRSVAPFNGCDGKSIAPSVPPTSSPVQPFVQGSLKIVAPGAGTPVSPGGTVTVAVEASDGFRPERVVIIGAGDVAMRDEPPFIAEFSIPAQAIGTLQFSALGIDEHGGTLTAGPVLLPVVSSARLVSMGVLDGDAILQGPGSKQRLTVLGTYDDGIQRNISSPSLGTVYASSNPNVATVTSDGLVTGTGPGIATITVRHGMTFTSINVSTGNNSFGSCIEVRLGDHNLFVLEDYLQGHYVQGRVAAGGNISLQDFSVGRLLPDTDTARALVAGGDLVLASGVAWGDVWYGGQLVSGSSVTISRGTASQGTPIAFAAYGSALRTLSSELAALPVSGTTTVKPWGSILLKGTPTSVNVFELDAHAFIGATVLTIQAPAGSLAVINVRGSSATIANFGQKLEGGIDKQGVLFNFPDATSLNVSGYGMVGSLLAPHAHVTFNDGRWTGGLYSRSLTGNASGYINPLRDTNICQ